jgi:hypothetical protein
MHGNLTQEKVGGGRLRWRFASSHELDLSIPGFIDNSTGYSKKLFGLSA